VCEELVEIPQHQLRHGAYATNRRTTDVWQQHDIVKSAQFRWNIWFLGEHVQSGAGQAPPGEEFDEDILVNDASAGDIDEVTVGSKGFQHRTAHQICGARAAGGGDHEHVNRLGEFNR
jgi:hypothetical protein